MPKMSRAAHEDSIEYNPKVAQLSLIGLWRILLKSLREFKPLAIITPLCVTLGVIVDCLIPFVTAMLVDGVTSGGGLSAIMHYSLILVGLALLSLGFASADGTLAARATTGLIRNIRHDLFAAVQNFSFTNIDKFSTSSLVTRMTTDCTNVQMAAMMMIRMMFRGAMMSIFAVVMAIVAGGPMAAIFLVASLLLVCFLVWLIRSILPRFREGFRQYDNLNARAEENIKGIRVVKSYVREDFEKTSFEKVTKRMYTIFRGIEMRLSLNMPAMNCAVDIIYAFMVYFGSQAIIASRGEAFNIGQMSALITYGFLMLMSLTMLSMVFMMVSMSEESARRIADVLVEEPTLANPEHPLMSVADGSIDFENVSFAYEGSEGREALAHLNLHINSGETIGILGGTGSSKSTLVQLICRLYDTTAGTVRVGGQDVRSYDLGVLRDAVAMVLQKNVLFSGTIAENLRWGNPDATDEEVLEASRLAQADEFVQDFPDTYDTMIEQGGSNVSGGQKQRLCIARALLKKPKILILDDSTSAVDTKTDRKIRAGLKNFMPDVTKIIIAQRTSSLEDADRILVMDRGAIVAVGTHQELLASNDIYRETYISQNKQSHDQAFKEEV